MRKIDNRLVGILGQKEATPALVRVHNTMHLSILERNFEVTHKFPFIRSVGINCALGDAIKLERMQEVEYVFAQSKVTALDDYYDLNTLSKLAKLENVSVFNQKDDENVFALSDRLDGEGVTLCVMDTGIAPHSDLSVPKERIVYFKDLIDGKEEPYDDNGHGTFVSGVACGDGLLSGRKIRGIAPKANLIGLKAIASNGETGTFKILEAMQWLFDNYRQYGVKVVCMSFGAEPMEYADPLKLGVEMLVRSGLTVICASGNSGPDSIKSPGISPEVISVGSVDENLKVADFSSYGEYNGIHRPDIYARGVKIKGLCSTGTYCMMSGTSVSAPYVAGASCLLLQKYKNMTPWQIKQTLLNTATYVNGVNVLMLD